MACKNVFELPHWKFEYIAGKPSTRGALALAGVEGPDKEIVVFGPFSHLLSLLTLRHAFIPAGVTI